LLTASQRYPPLPSLPQSWNISRTAVADFLRMWVHLDV
jgi:hypothetical protein